MALAAQPGRHDRGGRASSRSSTSRRRSGRRRSSVAGRRLVVEVDRVDAGARDARRARAGARHAHRELAQARRRHHDRPVPARRPVGRWSSSRSADEGAGVPDDLARPDLRARGDLRAPAPASGSRSRATWRRPTAVGSSSRSVAPRCSRCSSRACPRRCGPTSCCRWARSSPRGRTGDGGPCAPGDGRRRAEHRLNCDRTPADRARASRSVTGIPQRRRQVRGVTLYRLTPATQSYDWGSTTAIQDVLRTRPGRPARSPRPGSVPTRAPRRAIADGPGARRVHRRGPGLARSATGVAHRFGAHLPYLLKLIAADAPLSLQVHPDVERARAGFAAEDAAGIPLRRAGAQLPGRQPQARAGLRADPLRRDGRLPCAAARRRAAGRASTSRSRRGLHDILVADPTSAGVRAAFSLAARRRRPGPCARDVRRVRGRLRAPPRGRLAVAAHRPDRDAPRGAPTRATRVR